MLKRIWVISNDNFLNGLEQGNFETQLRKNMIHSHSYSLVYLQVTGACTDQRQTVTLAVRNVFIATLDNYFVQKIIQHSVFSKFIQVENHDHLI